MRTAAVAAAASLALGACSSVVDGTPTLRVAANANLAVVGDSGNPFDTTVKNALSDVIAFWQINYASISGGKSLPAIKGGFFSVDGAEVVQTGAVSGPAAKEGCVAKQANFIIDNAAFCSLDDSIVWDRNSSHLVGVLASKYGPLLIALAFAHEFGHALQHRLGIFDQNPPVIDTESQADCAAGAFLADIVANKAAHFRATPEQIDAALNGYLQVRDKTPGSAADISHGNGFDRILLWQELLRPPVHRASLRSGQRLQVRWQRDAAAGAQRQRFYEGPHSRGTPTRPEPVLEVGRPVHRQELAGRQDCAGRPPEMRPKRNQRVRLLPGRQHRLLQPAVRIAGVQQPDR